MDHVQRRASRGRGRAVNSSTNAATRFTPTPSSHVQNIRPNPKRTDALHGNAQDLNNVLLQPASARKFILPTPQPPCQPTPQPNAFTQQLQREPQCRPSLETVVKPTPQSPADGHYPLHSDTRLLKARDLQFRWAQPPSHAVKVAQTQQTVNATAMVVRPSGKDMTVVVEESQLAPHDIRPPTKKHKTTVEDVEPNCNFECKEPSNARRFQISTQIPDKEAAVDKWYQPPNYSSTANPETPRQGLTSNLNRFVIPTNSESRVSRSEQQDEGERRMSTVGPPSFILPGTHTQPQTTATAIAATAAKDPEIARTVPSFIIPPTSTISQTPKASNTTEQLQRVPPSFIIPTASSETDNTAKTAASNLAKMFVLPPTTEDMSDIKPEVLVVSPVKRFGFVANGYASRLSRLLQQRRQQTRTSSTNTSTKSLHRPILTGFIQSIGAKVGSLVSMQLVSVEVLSSTHPVSKVVKMVLYDSPFPTSSTSSSSLSPVSTNNMERRMKPGDVLKCYGTLVPVHEWLVSKEWTIVSG